MPGPATLLPCRRPELIARPFGPNGSYLVRNRRRGESFELGAEESFLLAQLDGRHTPESLCAAFTERFGEALTEEELQDFLHLADQRGLLQSDGVLLSFPVGANGFHEYAAPLYPDAERRARFLPPPAWTKQLAIRLLSASAASLRWLAGLLNRIERMVQWLRLARLEYVPRPDDIFIVTYPRSGTTWMQMILYQLTTDGNMDFPHIYEYCPWFENSIRCAGGFEGRPSPRLFKSHLSYRHIPKGPCKYIYIARNGKDVAVSYFHLHQSHNGYQGSFSEFFDLFLHGKVESGSWFRHVKSWWQHRDEPNVLFLRYEDLLKDLEGCLHKIIAFCGFEIAPQRFPVIVERCRFAFMKKHENQFDPQTGQLWERECRPNAFLRQGKSGDGNAHLSHSQARRFDKVFHQVLGQTEIHFGCNGRKLH